jgi:hypothetical protein
VDTVEVLTPFRRIAISAEERRAAGDRSFGQRQAIAIAGEAANRLELWVELSFHPLNTHVGVPGYEVTLVGPGGAAAHPIDINRVPRFGPRVEGAGPRLLIPGGASGTAGTQPLSGGTLIARFDGSALDGRATYVVLVSEGGRTVASAALDLGRLR